MSTAQTSGWSGSRFAQAPLRHPTAQVRKGAGHCHKVDSGLPGGRVTMWVVNAGTAEEAT
jgi:hypothetical protein